MNRFSEGFSDLLLDVEWWSGHAIRIVKRSRCPGTGFPTGGPSDWDIIKAPHISPESIHVQRSLEVLEKDTGEVYLEAGDVRLVIRHDLPSMHYITLQVLVRQQAGQRGDPGPWIKLVEEDSHQFETHGEPGTTKAFKVSQAFTITPDEGLYGLGQHRMAKMNWRDVHLDLSQRNTFVAIPLVLSTRGYGIMWEQTARSAYDARGDRITFSTDRAGAIGYWILVGSSFDEIIHEYRQLTGKAPLLPMWAYGFIQSRNRYWTRHEVMDVVKRHRKERLPIDVIVIDYMYYGRWGVGSHRFDEVAFPDPEGMIRQLHDACHVRLLLSIWPTFSPNADTYPSMRDRGYLLDCQAMGGAFYDPFNEAGGKAFWQILQDRLLVAGIDAWWLDASEPDDPTGFLAAGTAWGPGADHANVYSLLHTKHVHDGQRAASPDRRVFIITRSAFLGQQRHAAATWSGDILPTWDELRAQVASGLNFCAAGIPYWCTDIGGYKGGWARDPRYRELFVRWFQWGTFCPIFRSHGRRYPRNRKGKNEIWAFGRRATRILREFLNLRYRLMPYIYACAARVYHENDTMMRMLTFEFPNDPSARGIADQYLFGRALMVCPVSNPRQRRRDVYIPPGIWWDFWTGERITGPCTLTMRAPIERIPVVVRAGSILPLAPVMQHVMERPWNPLELRVYPGADGETMLYFDNGLDYRYERGESEWLSISWSDREGILTFHARHCARVESIPLGAIHVVIMHHEPVMERVQVTIDFMEMEEKLTLAPFKAFINCSREPRVP